MTELSVERAEEIVRQLKFVVFVLVVVPIVAEHVIPHARCPVLTVRLRSENELPLEKPEADAMIPQIQPL